jgi:hypothetical protein
MRELRAEGAAMHRDQACAYARIHIDRYLAAESGPRDQARSIAGGPTSWTSDFSGPNRA